MKYSESTLKNWCLPASNTEEEKIDHAYHMIKDALSKSPELQDLDIEVFVQGSYANNTNVRTTSDIDVCVMLKSTFFTHYPDGLTRKDYGFTDGSITYADYKNRILRAIQNKFGATNVTVGNKSLKVRSNSYHVDADVVVAFMLKDFFSIGSKNPNIYVEGIRFYATDGSQVSNYPKEHLKNGIAKNNRTNYEYKKLVRIFKRIRNCMVEDNVVDGNIISSFLVECLIWQVPDRIITSYSSWSETVKRTIIYLYNEIINQNHQEWGEVSERLYLFRGRKWTDTDAKKFLEKAWDYLGYANNE